MGTNYYWYNKPKCEYCGREDEPLHIGKSSYGWTFALAVHPWACPEISTLNDWKKRFKIIGSYIKDDEGDIIPFNEMINIITKRKGTLKRHSTEYRRVSRGRRTYEYIEGKFS